MITKSKSVLRDPRLRGAYQDFLKKQSTAKQTTPGLDLNRPNQGQSRLAGALNFTRSERPLNGGQQLQNSLRNRSTEQAGMNRPAYKGFGETT